MMVSLALQNYRVGIPMKKRVHQKTNDLQMRLKILSADLHNGGIGQRRFLRGIGHNNIRYKI